MGIRLNMTYTTAGGTETHSLDYVRSDVTATEVTSAMNAAINSGIFLDGLTGIDSAELVETTVTPLSVT